MREITVAVVQMAPDLSDVQANLRRMSDFIEEITSRQQTDLVVFPELATTGYENGSRFTDLAEYLHGPTVGFLAQRARAHSVHVAFGMPTKERVESILFDTAVLISPDGEVIGDYRKVHLRGEERLSFRPGFRYKVFDTAFGAAGLIVGWDLAFPEAARSLALDGAELVCVLANWEEPHVEEWRSLILARAYENACYIAAANRVGQEATYNFFGQSMIVGPRGELHASVDTEQEGYAVARIDLDQVRRTREEFQLMQARQPMTYRAIVRKY